MTGENLQSANLAVWGHGEVNRLFSLPTEQRLETGHELD